MGFEGLQDFRVFRGLGFTGFRCILRAGAGQLCAAADFLHPRWGAVFSEARTHKSRTPYDAPTL